MKSLPPNHWGGHGEPKRNHARECAKYGKKIDSEKKTKKNL